MNLIVISDNKYPYNNDDISPCKCREVDKSDKTFIVDEHQGEDDVDDEVEGSVP